MKRQSLLEALITLNDAIRETDAAGIFIAEMDKRSLAAGVADLGNVRGSARFAPLTGALLVLRLEDEDQGGNDPTLRLELHKARHGRSRAYQNGM